MADDRSADTVYPPVYPFSFFHSKNFRGAHDNPVGFLPASSDAVKIYSSSQLLSDRLMMDFESVRFERSGFMVGEYIVLETGLFLMNRKGTCVSINFPWESSLTARMPFDEVNEPGFWDRRQSLLDDWNDLPLVENAAVFSHIYHNNYYHFSFEFMQNFRLLESCDAENIIMPQLILSRRFQTDLIGRAMGERRVVPLTQPLRVRNPVVAQAYQSYEGLRWLRNIVDVPARAGQSRYYIRRSPEKIRRGNNVSESVAFLSFLERWDFQIIDFGNGENAIETQIRMMDGAAVIIAPHGAGLTNISYLNAPLTIVEIFGRSVLSASFMQIAICLGFKYHGFISEEMDEEGNIVADVDQLEAIMQELVG